MLWQWYSCRASSGGGVTILVTGGAGFIGANFVLDWLRESDEPIVNLDALTYAGNLESLATIFDDSRHHFSHGDISDSKLVATLLESHEPDSIVHFAAESHVDRSIHGPDEFILTNVVGTFRLLETARTYYESLDSEGKRRFRFVNVSTDEVFGSLEPESLACNETSRYAPNSPYSASKAAADHLCRAYFHTYGLPVITTNCSNNYGPYQFPEKLIPLMIRNGALGKSLPVYGDGLNVRDWLYVGDHCAALRQVLKVGVPGQTYNIGGDEEMTNISVVVAICDALDEIVGDVAPGHHSKLITYVQDRPGHDRRYAIDASKMATEFDWRPREVFATGLRKTVEWYFNNEEWIASVESGEYRRWIDTNYGQRATDI